MVAVLNAYFVNTYDMASILSDAFTVFTAYRFFSVFSTAKRNAVITGLLYLLYGIAIVISSILIRIPVVNLIVTIVAVSAIAMSYRIDWRKALLNVAVYCFVLFVVELLIGIMTGYTVIQPLVKSEYDDVFGLFLCRFGTFFVILLLKNVRFIRQENTPPTAYLFATIFIPSSSIVVEAMIVSIDGVTKSIVLFSMGIFILINILVFTLYDKISAYYENQIEMVSLKQENLFYCNQLKSMSESVNDTRAFRHDVLNHFNMIESYLKARKYDKTVMYLQNLKKSDIVSENIIVNSGNFVIDSVLNYKLSLIKDINIDIDLDILVPQDLNIDTVHFVSILTNLLDNAIEALNSIKILNNRILRIRICYTKGRMMMLFQNTYEEDIIYENGHIGSSKKNTDNHGYGLENVNKALKHYDGLIKITHDDKVFSVQLLLYIK